MRRRTGDVARVDKGGCFCIVDRDGLEIPCAFVALQEGARGDILDEIPKNPTGKILRKDLRLIPLEG